MNVVHVDSRDGRQVRGAARLFGVKITTLQVWIMQQNNGGHLDYDRMPKPWLQHAVQTLKAFEARHGAMSMHDVLDLLADDPPPPVQAPHPASGPHRKRHRR